MLSSGAAIPNASARMNEMIAYVRTFLRDFPELNRLTQGYENSPRMIAWAIIDALDDWNSTPPFIGTATIESFPSKSLLCRGATIALLESVGLLQTRNQLTFSDGGISVSVSDKAPLIMNWLQLFKQSYEDKKSRFKSSANVEMAMDGSGTFSEYFIINGIYLTDT
jgi:hypothetical protein